MSEHELKEDELHVLDIITNLEPISQYRLAGFWLTKNRALTSEQLNEILEKLSQLQLISIQKDEYEVKISLNASLREKVVNILSDYWTRRKVKKEILLLEADKNHTGVLKLLELKSTFDDKPRIGFSDYYWDSPSHGFCLKLLEINMAFKHTASSRKHFYEDYYLR